MKRSDQRKLLRTFCNHVRDALLVQASEWPEEWDGHDLRELVAYAYVRERTSLMYQSRGRRRKVHNEIVVRRLY